MPGRTAVPSTRKRSASNPASPPQPRWRCCSARLILLDNTCVTLHQSIRWRRVFYLGTSTLRPRPQRRHRAGSQSGDPGTARPRPRGWKDRCRRTDHRGRSEPPGSGCVGTACYPWSGGHACPRLRGGLPAGRADRRDRPGERCDDGRQHGRRRCSHVRWLPEADREPSPHPGLRLCPHQHHRSDRLGSRGDAQHRLR